MKKAVITGVTGQDGSYLAELLLQKGYEVHGFVRRTSTLNRARLQDIYRSGQSHHRRFFLHYGDMTDSSSLLRMLGQVRPDEIYNLAAQSHVRVSFEIPEYTAQCDAVGVLRFLEAVRCLGLTDTRIYQASTSEMYGNAEEVPQTESTPFAPVSPYGCAKLYAFTMSGVYRESYGLFVSNGILFNHESPRRGENFVTRKIAKSVAEIRHGRLDAIHLGNLDAERDWGYAPEYVDAMWRILQAPEPGDYVVATGESHTVREFVETAFDRVGMRVRWEGKGTDERGIDEETGRALVTIDARHYRPIEVRMLRGDATKARERLEWHPHVRFGELVALMVDAEVRALEAGDGAT